MFAIVILLKQPSSRHIVVGIWRHYISQYKNILLMIYMTLNFCYRSNTPRWHSTKYHYIIAAVLPRGTSVFGVKFFTTFSNWWQWWLMTIYFRYIRKPDSFPLLWSPMTILLGQVFFYDFALTAVTSSVRSSQSVLFLLNVFWQFQPMVHFLWILFAVSWRYFFDLLTMRSSSLAVWLYEAFSCMALLLWFCGF